ncbi:Fc receptor-like protein 5 isoform X1 [Arapaima gigas]
MKYIGHRLRSQNKIQMLRLQQNIYLLVLLCSAWIAEPTVRIDLSADPTWTEVLTGDTVTLTCAVTGSDPDMEWEYLWIKLRNGEENSLSNIKGAQPSKFTIDKVKEADSAQYWCTAKTQNQTFTSLSHTVQVTAPPQAVLSLQSGQTEMFPTERATLRCDLQGSSSHWDYKWYKDGQKLPGNIGKNYLIPSATVADSGKYTCVGQYHRGKLSSKESKSISIEVSALPKAVLTLQSEWTEMFPTEKATLRETLGHTGVEDSIKTGLLPQ